MRSLEDTSPFWAGGPTHPRLAIGGVDVWMADLSTVDGGVVGVLSEAELARAARLLSDTRRERWIRARGVLRTLLGRYLGADPPSLRFSYSARGKPALAGEEGTRGLHFNLSHSGETMLCAVSGMGPVGVDVQLAREELDVLAIARRAFGAAPAHLLEALEGEHRKREFLQMWTRYEASVKCMGIGVPSSPGGHDAWITDLDVGGRAAAALAVQGRPREVRRWRC